MVSTKTSAAVDAILGNRHVPGQWDSWTLRGGARSQAHPTLPGPLARSRARAGNLTIGYRSRYAKYFGNNRWRRVSMSTEFPSKNGVQRQWHVIDADGLVVGKLAS